MKYSNNIDIKLGDLITVSLPEGEVAARVVMLGETYEHLPIDDSFLSWVIKDRVLEESSIVVEFVDINPYEHNDPAYAPVGNYMFTVICSCIVFIKRGH